MRLLTWNNLNELSLTDPLDSHDVPPYAILSHTWGDKRDEVDFADLQQGRAKHKRGYEKIRFCSEQAQRDGIKHFWVDTCCIDKTNAIELPTAINSMYRWYRDAKKCYVYLSDVSVNQSDSDIDKAPTWKLSLRKSRWFTRGWTLQELLAPKVVEFFSCEGVFLGTKETLAGQIQEATTIPMAALYGASPTQYSIAERWRWAAKRKTSKEEDKAYCLLGIFDVTMPLIYGEGRHAFYRLQNEISQRSVLSVCEPMVDIHTHSSLELESHPAQKRYVCNNSEHVETASKRRMIDQSTADRASERVRALQHDQQYDKDVSNVLLKSLLFNQFNFRFNNVDRALLSTCEWLLRHPDFQTWYKNEAPDRHSGFFWIKGKPGCGKSTLMKAALEWARRKTPKRLRQTIVPYFFNARASGPLEKSALGLYRTVVYRLLTVYDSLRDLFMDKFALKDPGSEGANWTAEELQDFLSDSVESSESFKLCLFIDALDEAEYESDVRQMISFLIQLSDRALAASGSCQLQICLSSRHYPYITIGRGLSLVVEDEPGHGHDIEVYVRKQLTCSEGSEKDSLQVSILDKSARIFLWVVLVVKMLNKLNDRGAPPSDMQARLETIPAGLEQLFREILLKSHHGIDTTVLFLQWALYSTRPLEPTELFIAIQYSRSSADLLWKAPPSIRPPPPDRLARYILDCSHGLVEIAETELGQPTVVQFIHETVREFLAKDNGLVSVVPALATNLAGLSHEILRIACLRCISDNAIPDDYLHYTTNGHKNKASRAEFVVGMRQRYPFLEYAISHLFDHAEQAQKQGVSQEAFLRTQTDGDGRCVGPYRLWRDVLERYGVKKRDFSDNLLYLVVERKCFSLLPVLSALPNVIKRVDDSTISVLDQELNKGCLESVQAIVEGGVDVNIPGSWYTSPLSVASARGKNEIVRFLLKAGANVNSYQGSDAHFTALFKASASGHEQTVKILLDAGAHTDVDGKTGRTALMAASAGGYEQIVRMLLEAGAKVNAINRTQHNHTALSEASRDGHEQIVRMLLDAGANAYIRGERYIALQEASRYGYEEIVRMLLEAGADVDIQGGDYGSALCEASAGGYEQIVKMLLDAGADANAGRGTGDSPLRLASTRSRKRIVQMLKAYGAKMES